MLIQMLMILTIKIEHSEYEALQKLIEELHK